MATGTLVSEAAGHGGSWGGGGIGNGEGGAERGGGGFRLVLDAGAPAAQRNDGDAERAVIDGGDGAGRVGVDFTHDRSGCQVTARALHQVGRAAKRRDHAAEAFGGGSA